MTPIASNETEPAALASFDDLVALLTHDNVPHQADAAQGRVVIPTESGPLVGEMLLLWEADSPVVQFIHPLDFEVPMERIAAAESAIARINHALVLPGFGLDHDHRYLYYRLSTPRRPDGTLLPDEVERLFRTTVNTARDFFLPLQAVALRGADPANVVAAAGAATGAASAGPNAAGRPNLPA